MINMSRSVLITGASRGIGRAIAHAFAASGDRVAIHYHRSRDLAGSLLAALPGDGHVTVQGDVTDPGEVQQFVDAAATALAGLDVLVNNAGVFEPHSVTDSTYEQWQASWRHTIETNLTGPANVIWCAVRHLRPGGRIVNVSSRGAFRGEPGQPGYGASKAGLNALSQSLAVALAPRGIAVTVVAPGYVETDMASDVLRSDRGAQIRAQSPLDRVARPEEVAAAVHWLASPEAEWATGTILDLNGASYLRT
jgi:3-oxoacyl-[acyl-carrier protein] reductase